MGLWALRSVLLVNMQSLRTNILRTILGEYRELFYVSIFFERSLYLLPTWYDILEE